MESDQQIIHYLEEVADVLVELQVMVPFFILVTGGAYMMLNHKRAFTEDIDFALVEQPQLIPQQNQVFQVTVTSAEVFRAQSTVPFSAEFRQAVLLIAQRHPGLAKDWLNDEAAEYYYDDAPRPDVTFWRSFRDVLYVYLPTQAYVFATKIAAYRPKDERDIQILMHDLNLTTRVHAQAIIDRFLLPDAQAFWQVEENLDLLFP